MHQSALDKLVDNRKVHGVSVAVCRLTTSDNSVAEPWIGAAGNLTSTTPFFIASTTKLMMTAVLRQLRREGRLGFDDPIGQHLGTELLQDLLIIDGVQQAPSLTIRQLMSHTSGLPDYFQRKVAGKSLQDELFAGSDRSWTLEDVLERSRGMRPEFRPGQAGRAEYSDTNYQLLGRIVEVMEGAPIAEVLQRRLFEPLGMTSTYMYTDPSDSRPMTLYYKQSPLRIPKAMTSFGPDGGVVSTSSDMMIFLRAFFGDALAPSEDLDELTSHWNRIWFPFTYGTGIMRFRLPRILSPFQAQPELIGHSGLSGAFAFYAPAKRTFITGTVNQLAYPDTSFRLMLKLVNERS
jgi:CubicO group peptidase (beta-lactamase class C family)